MGSGFLLPSPYDLYALKGDRFWDYRSSDTGDGRSGIRFGFWATTNVAYDAFDGFPIWRAEILDQTFNPVCHTGLDGQVDGIRTYTYQLVFLDFLPAWGGELGCRG